MSAALRPFMTAAEYLDWEQRQELRYEFGGVCPVAMMGGTRNHAVIQANLITALRSRLRGTVPGVWQRTENSGRWQGRYADAFITCTPGQGTATFAADPVVAFEIVSASSGAVDRVIKNVEYRNTATIRRYVILEQTDAGAEMFTRAGEDWAGRPQGAGSVLPMPEAGIEVPLEELYSDVDLQPGFA